MLVGDRRRAIEEPWDPIPGEIEFFLNDVEDGIWLCRRDERVTRPVAELTTRTAAGTPIVVPEIQLLYKAKHHLDKDEHDFRHALGESLPSSGPGSARPSRSCTRTTPGRLALIKARPASSPLRA